MRADSLKAWTETPVGRAANLEVSIHQTLESTHLLYRFGEAVPFCPPPLFQLP